MARRDGNSCIGSIEKRQKARGTKAKTAAMQQNVEKIPSPAAPHKATRARHFAMGIFLRCGVRFRRRVQLRADAPLCLSAGRPSPSFRKEPGCRLTKSRLCIIMGERRRYRGAFSVSRSGSHKDMDGMDRAARGDSSPGLVLEGKEWEKRSGMLCTTLRRSLDF